MNHNHVTRDIKPYGQCPACDHHHELVAEARLPEMKAAIDNLPPAPQAKVGDKHEGQHMACRLCNPKAGLGDTVIGLCGAEYVLDGIATNVEVARENRACADCIEATQEHVYEAHPDLIGLG